MSVDVSTEIVIDRSVDVVFDYAANPDTALVTRDTGCCG